MCGIFGIHACEQARFSRAEFMTWTRKLAVLAESRGKEASGLAFSTGREIKVLKRNIRISKLIRTREFNRQLFSHFTGHNGRPGPGGATLTGHSRMVTDGDQDNPGNNQPVIKHNMITIHNGIIVNHLNLWRQYPQLERNHEVDTEILPELFHHFYSQSGSLIRAISDVYGVIEGIASLAILFGDRARLLLSSNNGSLYFMKHRDGQRLVFASDKHMLSVMQTSFTPNQWNQIEHVSPGTGRLVNTLDMAIEKFRLDGETDAAKHPAEPEHTRVLIEIQSDRPARPPVAVSRQADPSLLQDNSEAINRLQRCTKCLLPATFPFITYDEQGVCHFCNDYKRLKYRGRAELEQLFRAGRERRDFDCIVPLSGGRDSSYMLHYLKKEMGLNPVAYTYDWGMVTDLARRNISRLCARLGIEHILISADITKKRKFIRDNVNAWLKRPKLGTVPLFMAGDKQFFYYANKLKAQLNTELIIFGMNPLERTDFKVAFCGFQEKRKQKRHYHLGFLDKLKLLGYYGREFLANPGYLNLSLMDSLWAYLSYYFIQHNYCLFFEYIEWNEKRINDTIIGEYDWETAEDTETTWRIGDGTASFYNYIYHTIAGFSENDTFRSNQIRQGIISREEALRMASNENRHRFESMKWYCDVNGIDFNHAIATINKIPKLY